MWVETQRSVQSSFQKLNVDNSFQKTCKIRYYIFEVLSNFTVFFYFVPNILARIAVSLCFVNACTITETLFVTSMLNQTQYFSYFIFFIFSYFWYLINKDADRFFVQPQASYESIAPESVIVLVKTNSFSLLILPSH